MTCGEGAWPSAVPGGQRGGQWAGHYRGFIIVDGTDCGCVDLRRMREQERAKRERKKEFRKRNGRQRRREEVEGTERERAGRSHAPNDHGFLGNPTALMLGQSESDHAMGQYPWDNTAVVALRARRKEQWLTQPGRQRHTCRRPTHWPGILPKSVTSPPLPAVPMGSSRRAQPACMKPPPAVTLHFLPSA